MSEQKKRARSKSSTVDSGNDSKRGKAPRTAGGKKGSPEVLAEASIGAQEGYRERTEAGHRAAGRTPPSQKSAARTAGSARIVDDSIRSWIGPETEDEKLLQTGNDRNDFTRVHQKLVAHGDSADGHFLDAAVDMTMGLARCAIDQ